jgi:hypothetical protein
VSVVLRIVGLSGGAPSPWDGRWLVEFDPDKRGRDPVGRATLAHVVVTDDIERARRFHDAAQAWEFWRRPSKRWPREGRSDGKPNRPMTAFSVTIYDPEAQR